MIDPSHSRAAPTRLRLRAAAVALLAVAVTACAVAPAGGPVEKFGSVRAPAPALAPATATPAVALGRATEAAQARARQERIFQQLWTTVNERYLYADFNGLDWTAERQRIAARIAAGLSDEEFHALLSELISALNDDHSSFLSPEEARSEDDEYASAGTYTGVGLVTDVNTTTRHIYVLTVLPDSPAERAGIQPHDHILEIAGEPSVDENGNSMSQLLRGEKGTSVDVLVRTPGQEPRLVQLIRDAVSSTERITGRILSGDGRIGYLNVPSLFERDVIARARQTLRDLMKDGPLDGLILDLRTNGGGSFPNLRDLLGLFTSGTLGHLVDRAGAKSAVRARANGIGNSQSVPLVVLIGPATESFAEVLAGALQAKGRARLIGQNSAGNIETLLAHEFEDGSRLWLAEEGFRLPDGGSWELVGLTPDVRVDQNWDEYTAANDPVIAEAVRLLR